MSCKDTQVIQVVLDGLNNMLKLAGQGKLEDKVRKSIAEANHLSPWVLQFCLIFFKISKEFCLSYVCHASL